MIFTTPKDYQNRLHHYSPARQISPASMIYFFMRPVKTYAGPAPGSGPTPIPVIPGHTTIRTYDKDDNPHDEFVDKIKGIESEDIDPPWSRQHKQTSSSKGQESKKTDIKKTGSSTSGTSAKKKTSSGSGRSGGNKTTQKHGSSSQGPDKKAEKRNEKLQKENDKFNRKQEEINNKAEQKKGKKEDKVAEIYKEKVGENPVKVSVERILVVLQATSYVDQKFIKGVEKVVDILDEFKLLYVLDKALGVINIIGNFLDIRNDLITHNTWGLVLDIVKLITNIIMDFVPGIGIEAHLLWNIYNLLSDIFK